MEHKVEVKKVTPGEEHQEIGPKLSAHRLDGQGREIVDSRPMAPPIGFKPQESIFDQMRQLMRAASLEAAQAGDESFEEANDFYIPEDPGSRIPPSGYEWDEDHELELQELLHMKAAAEARSEGANSPGEAEPPNPPGKKKKQPSTPPEPLGGSEGAEA